MNIFYYFIGYLTNLLHKFENYYLRNKNIKLCNCGRNVRIEAGNTIQWGENITIGNNTYMNGGGYLMASPNANIIIGNNCLISYNVHIRTDMHTYKKGLLMMEQPNVEKSIYIGNDCWIGFGAQILGGVNIADGSVIGAGAVVTKDTEPNGIYVGVPARLIKYRM